MIKYLCSIRTNKESPLSEERGNFEGGDTITVAELCKQRGMFGYVAVSEIRVDNANVIVLPHSATVHRMPPANPG